jgi:hypothetical protein
MGLMGRATGKIQIPLIGRHIGHQIHAWKYELHQVGLKMPTIWLMLRKCFIFHIIFQFFPWENINLPKKHY